MAYQTRGRDPLFDSNMAEAIEKRGKELLGIALMVLAAAAAAMVISYHPDDPSFLSATDQPVQNWLGRFGASIAAPLFMIVGWAAWGLPVVLGAWGLRLVLHRGAERAVGRLIFGPIWIAVLSLYAASLTPGAAWLQAHSFGLGGLFGDTVMGSVLNILPVDAVFGLKALSLALAVVLVLLGAFVLGFTRLELRAVVRFLLVGLVVIYAGFMRLMGYGARGTMHVAQGVQARAAERRAERAQAQQEAWAAEEWAASHTASVPPAPRVRRADPVIDDHAPEQDAYPEEPQRGGLFARMPSLIRRDPMPEPELVMQETALDDTDIDMPGDDRIKAKIADVIKSRARVGPAVAAAAPLTKGRGRGPDPLLLNTDRRAPDGLPPEPPLTAAHAAPDPESRSEPAIESYSEAPQPAPAAYEQTPQPDGLPLTDTPPRKMQIPVPEPRKVVQHPPRKPVQPSVRARAEAQPTLPLEDRADQAYDLPPLSLLESPENVQRLHLSDEALEENARMLETVLDDYGVKGEIVSVRPGPVVTMYELEPAPGLKASRVIGLADDIARSMSALSARVSTVPGRSVIGIELPNDHREMVNFREVLSSRDYGDGTQKLPLALGKDIGGDPVVANLAKMPHLLIAGTTGSGKSVAINTMILSLLYKLTPDECRLIMIDPKMLELSVYDGIPHLLSPVVTDPKKAVVALKWVVGEMEERYRKMSKMGVRNIDGYNSRVADALAKGEMFSRTVQTGFDDETGEPVFETEEFAPEKMPYIVVIVDEMADLMMVAGKEIEACIQRLAQMARASGIHLIMATQRPSVDVITGTIKANFPTRISFQVTSKIDSRTILGEQGAEQLLGQGDMLYMAGGAKIMRCHAPFVSDEEVEEIVNHLKSYGPPEYVGGVVEGPDDEKADNIDAVLGLNTGGNTTGEDALYDQAVAIAIKDRKCSTSYVQRKLGIGYNKAARLVEQMEDEGIVSAANHVGKREILVPEQ
ncbi:DNA translocase FtsK 4TM domain-containing protein [Lutimaribacter sp. EGI FJ00015]|uniref:DNA translocase FtsK 4TM domain-containing protein n=1 Tax=Lutimaribacter degradans TaxID=2945989 RepID=A0ACC5ZZ57_9RHOB|nr:DNA translocase FtsK [Lutimaribacter sp. EGI FJ00013]MCM2562824.1 DNA translocase FtsK 4TM domain-containing protein [Lutimaribacter sp. EGI FJ00013]MCO0613981.1 DNA translocase FtsK 4TM domain-containing protein [Lutimaribacter sp. EGI FJ00015]MCO0636953.1 DNA translocase FtsK 4TM domain-containing protein [Lutimaribacter sp. EGI FJ00014]